MYVVNNALNEWSTVHINFALILKFQGSCSLWIKAVTNFKGWIEGKKVIWWDILWFYIIRKLFLVAVSSVQLCRSLVEYLNHCCSCRQRDNSHNNVMTQAVMLVVLSGWLVIMLVSRIKLLGWLLTVTILPAHFVIRFLLVYKSN